jgi:hypothetical protein
VDQSNPQSELRKPVSEKKSPLGRATAPERPQAARPVVSAHAPEAPPAQKLKIESQNSKAVAGAARTAGIKQPASQNSGVLAEQPQKLPQVSASKAQRVPAVRAKHEQIASEQGRLKRSKDQNQKVLVQQIPQGKPAEPPSSQ